MAKDNKQKPAQGSVPRAAVDSKTAIINSLKALQDCHPKSSDLWTEIQKAIDEVSSITDPKILDGRKAILVDEFKKAMGDIVSEK